MSILISNNVLQQTKLTETELRLEIALMLFQQKRFTLGQAAAFTNLTQTNSPYI